MPGVLMLVVARDASLAAEALACAEGQGCTVRVRESLFDGLVDLEANPEIGLILMEASLEDAALAEDLALIRATGVGADLPVMLLYPANASETALTEGLDAGADACLTRPLQCPTLRAWLLMASRLKAMSYSITGVAREAMGRVSEPLLRSASLSHALSGPLQNIASAIDLVELALPDQSEEQAQVATIRSNVQRAADIVRTASEEARMALRRVDGHA